MKNHHSKFFYISFENDVNVYKNISIVVNNENI